MFGWGDTLVIKNQLDSICTKSPKLEGNWEFTIETGEKKIRTQRCYLTVIDDDFN